MKQYFPRDFSETPHEDSQNLITCYKCGGKFDPDLGEIREYAVRFSSGKTSPRNYCTTTRNHRGCYDTITKIPAIPTKNLDLYRRFTIFKNVRGGR